MDKKQGITEKLDARLGKLSPWTSLAAGIFAFASFAILIANYVEDRKDAKVETEIVVRQLLDEAWDAIGGGAGVGILTTGMMANTDGADLILAERKLAEAEILDPGNARIELIRGYVHEASFDIELAFESYSKALDDPDVNLMATVAISNLARRAGLVDVSIDLYREIIDENPNSENVWLLKNNLASALMDVEEFDEAAALYEEIVDKYPVNCSMITHLGMAQTGQGKLDEAERNLAKAIALCPENQVAQMNYGHVLQLQGRFEDALPVYKAATQLGHPRYDGSYSVYGFVLLKLNRLDEAEEAINEALARNPENFRSWEYKGIILSQTNRHKKAISSFKRSIELQLERDADQEELSRSYSNLAISYVQLGNPHDARENAEFAVKLDPSSSLAIEVLEDINSRPEWAESAP
jgi:tetratricopeptide (TPR) repeat protein